MNHQFRKKPVVIEAFQMTEERRRSNEEWPEWLHVAWNRGGGEGALFLDADDPERQRLVLGTLEGVHRVQWGDWIIKGVKSELYPCKPDIFEATYEKVYGTVQEAVDDPLGMPGIVTTNSGKRMAAAALEAPPPNDPSVLGSALEEEPADAV